VTRSALLLGGLALLAAAPARADVRRCEDDKGRVTYSNEACPSGTARERPVEQRPPVELPQGGGEKASHSGVLKPTVSEPGRAPEQRVQETNREQNKAQVAHCDDLVRRIEYSQQDLLTATGAERASVELGVRRLQDEYQSGCAHH
jgi:hypothetical protein